MNANAQPQWKHQLLEFALAAFAAHEPLRSALIFKGARILNLRLGNTPSRESFDLDSNLVETHLEKAACLAFIDRESSLALKRHIARQNPAHFSFKSVKVELSPPRGNHPFDWTGFTISALSVDKANKKQVV